MDWDFYTQQGVLDMQKRLAEVVRAHAAERGLRLTPDGLVFFDGSGSLPAHGAPWKITLHTGQGKADVVLSASDLADFKAGRRSTVPAQIGTALDSLRRA